MRRKSGRANILRRIEELEARSMDGSGFALHSLKWLAFWQRQVHLYMTGQEGVRLTLEGVRAVMQATPDDPYDRTAEEALVRTGLAVQAP